MAYSYSKVQQLDTTDIGNVDDDGLRLIAGEYFASRLTDRFKPKKKELPKYI
jgi:hypothetical protein